jgi:hypothetical protein
VNRSPEPKQNDSKRALPQRRTKHEVVHRGAQEEAEGQGAVVWLDKMIVVEDETRLLWLVVCLAWGAGLGLG